ncbi:MAG: hypothetical protein AAFQ58_19140 [Pseudomonadota bacterium]
MTRDVDQLRADVRKLEQRARARRGKPGAEFYRGLLSKAKHELLALELQHAGHHSRT